MFVTEATECPATAVAAHAVAFEFAVAAEHALALLPLAIDAEPADAERVAIAAQPAVALLRGAVAAELADAERVAIPA